MRRHPLYLVFGILVVLAVTAAELRGWGMTTPDEVRGVPASVRDNPASYRPVYIFTGSSIRRGK
jgi:hypothetical protein